MFSTLITKGNESSRLKKAAEIRESLSIGANSPDLILIDEENTIGIDKVRELKNRTKYAPIKDPNKLIILNNADRLTPEAQNALLKILEEPPLRTYFILLANSKKSFLPTILSRCQIIELRTFDIVDITDEDFKESLVWDDILNSTENKDKLNKALTWAEKISTSSFPSKTAALEFLEKQTVILRKLIPGTSNKEIGELPKISVNQAVSIIRLLEECQKNINSNVNPRQCLENLFFEVSELAA